MINGNNKNSFELGDAVKLKAGRSPEMLVVETTREGMAKVTWFSGDGPGMRKEYASYPMQLLVLATEVKEEPKSSDIRPAHGGLSSSQSDSPLIGTSYQTYDSGPLPETLPTYAPMENGVVEAMRDRITGIMEEHHAANVEKVPAE